MKKNRETKVGRYNKLNNQIRITIYIQYRHQLQCTFLPLESGLALQVVVLDQEIPINKAQVCQSHKDDDYNLIV